MKKGFTLIELLVVVLIIGILAAVAVPQYQIAVEKARTVQAISIINSMMKAFDLYILSNGYPPATGWTELIGSGVAGNPIVGLLDIDAESVLDCSEDEDYCNTKHSGTSKYWSFDGGCGHSGSRNRDDCKVEANLCSQKDGTERCEYTLSTYKPYNEGKWEFECLDKAISYPYTTKLCKNLEGQGWTYTRRNI